MYNKPSKLDLQNAVNRTIPDLIAPNLKVLFCGINPGLYSAATGHHFAKPGNRFWRALNESGLTPAFFHPSQEFDVLSLGFGITNIVPRATVSADELSDVELIEGSKELENKIRYFKPKWLAILGIGAYRTAFSEPKAILGKQDRVIGNTQIWVLPSPSGLNAHFTPKDFAQLFAELKNVCIQ